ncbi:uncharacterized protein AB675_3098 [Cyphellophora attinorum]|uniref:Uncharacterized protein n=1 Tax=Cyphellophora attinorum TaxID=1664694 RepID=A0A0N1NZ77_9EURO|nr:uncharacterized protein AB675_3098 [Phialophora attinorum]KPI37923.1 hypothetical protein AB675_3098 [Phialophora attinorum]
MATSVQPPHQQQHISHHAPPSLSPHPEAPSQPQTQSWAAWLLDAYATTATSPSTNDFPHEHDDEHDSHPEQTEGRLHPVIQRQQQRWFSDSDAFKRSSTSTVTAMSSDRYTPQQQMMTLQAQTSGEQSRHQKQPFTRTGRGGAGNFVWGSLNTGRASVTSAPSSISSAQDVIGTGQGPSLAQRRAAAKKLQRLDNVRSVGRGGAGNIHINSATSPGVISSARSPLSQGQRFSNDTPTSSARSVSTPTTTNTTTPATTTSETSSTSYAYGRGGAGNQLRAEAERAQQKQALHEQEQREMAERRKRIEQQVDEWLLPPPVAMVPAGAVGRRGSWGS